MTQQEFTFAIAHSTPKTAGAFIMVSDFLFEADQHVCASLHHAGISQGRGCSIVTCLIGRDPAVAASPLGCFNAPGITTVAGTSASYDTVLEMISAVEAASALLTPASAGFVLPASIAQTLRATEKATGSGMVMVRNDLAGYPGIVTEATSPSTLAFADWSQLLLLEYNVLEIGTDPYGASGSAQFRAGRVAIRALWNVDSVLLNPASFAVSGALS